ncbi:MAG: hypothetical protein M1819_000027 [Sarea resinae]|nr:MAG: hypothetical protein M1819_000027 [Sarea resinae]
MSKSNAELHSLVVLSEWSKLLRIVNSRIHDIGIDGSSLDIASVVAVGRYAATASLSDQSLGRIQKSADYLTACLDRGDCIYGVNTGFGGSADTRPKDILALQQTLIGDLSSGVLATPDVPERLVQDPSIDRRISADDVAKEGHPTGIHAILSKTALPNGDPVLGTIMPEAWVRASMVVRSNSLASGNSGVRPEVLRNLVAFLQKNIVPAVPLRGSISASGDLSPLSYIAAALQGGPGRYVWTGERKSSDRHIARANAVLAELSIPKLTLGPKEGLAIVNGTAVSTAVGALALHDAHGLAVLSQVLTAMGVEALRGSIESFDPFLAEIRPHQGQIESARNIRGFLIGSKLAHSGDHEDDGSLRQDRYAIRTSTQWIGPQLENLVLAHNQVSIECNSTTDNPIIDGEHEHVLHGGNFQAMAISSAMEKTRTSLQIIGRMLFAQCTELINPALNNGLPPNLTADEPSQSYLMKGVDISVAALQSELGFLANAVSSHVQTAEMGNQSLNSLALISARYTHVALDVLSQLAASYLLVVCQALDLRAMWASFLAQLRPAFEDLTRDAFGSILPQQTHIDQLIARLWLQLSKELDVTRTLDSAERFPYVIEALEVVLLNFQPLSSVDGGQLLPIIRGWTSRCSTRSREIFLASRNEYAQHPDATHLLGSASTRMYGFVRGELGIPFLRDNQWYSRGPINPGEDRFALKIDENREQGASPVIGSLVTIIYNAIRDGSLFVPTMECLREVWQDDRSQTGGPKL